MKSQNYFSRHKDSEIYKNVEVEKVIPGGDGLVRIDGKVVFVPGALEGETIDIIIVSEGRRFSRGQILEIRRPSDRRIEPLCPYYGSCGGCNLQHLGYEDQLELKESFVREHFRRLTGIELPDDFGFTASPPWGYRNRVQFHRADHGAGFKMRGSDRILHIDRCPVLTEPFNRFLASGESLSLERETFFADDTRWWSESSGEEIEVPLEGRRILFRADLFFQSNLKILPRLIDFALADVQGTHGMDLYCGVGLFSVFMKERFKEITAIELNPEVESAYRNNMGDYPFEFFGQSLEKWLRRKGRRKADFILVDPPRTGLSAKAREFLIRIKAPEISYVSCDPVTQARDVKELLDAGYVMEGIRGFDFYPQTHHMETVLRLRLR